MSSTLPEALAKNSHRFNPRRIAWLAIGRLFLGVCATIACYAVLIHFPAVRVGDGAEYYALERTISLSHRPFMTDAGWAGYERMLKEAQVESLQPAEHLQRAFAGLQLGSGADFNHFWFYSAAAALIGMIGSTLGFSDTSHAHFMLLHALMLAILLLLCLKTHGSRGALSALVLTVLSPALWFSTKVHTEFFTISLTIGAIACAMRRSWAPAGLLLAVAGTQNISFTIPAAFACLLALRDISITSRPGRLIALDAVAIAAAGLVAALHPAYYFFRFGAIDPQLITTGAKTSGISPFSSLQYLVDPDVGLLPNWPLGLLLLVTAGAAFTFMRKKLDHLLLSFVVVYVAAAMIAQAASTNINSGATVGLARYGLWYVCLTYPALILLFKHMPRLPPWALALTPLMLLGLGGMNVRAYWPTHPESYTKPTGAAALIYAHAPWLWDPAVEVFSEKNAQIGEAIPTGRAVIMGPNCAKALYIPGPEDTLRLFPAGACGTTPIQLETLLKQRHLTNIADPTYFSLSEDDLAKMAPVLRAGVRMGPQGVRPYLVSGWSVDEPWGVWSLGKTSLLRFRAPMKMSSGTKISLYVTGFWFGSHQQISVGAEINGIAQEEVLLSSEQPHPIRIEWPLPPVQEGQPVTIRLTYRQPASPKGLGMSIDSRELAIGLTALELHHATR